MLVPWCGLLLDTGSLELRGDYRRLFGSALSDGLTHESAAPGGMRLAARLQQYARPKLIPLLLDASVNSRATVALNVYQAMLVVGMKLHCHVRKIGRQRNEAFLLHTVVQIAAFAARLALRRCQAAGHGCRCELRASELRALALAAFGDALMPKQSLYGAELLASLARQEAGEIARSTGARALVAGARANDGSRVMLRSIVY